MLCVKSFFIAVSVLLDLYGFSGSTFSVSIVIMFGSRALSLVLTSKVKSDSGMPPAGLLYVPKPLSFINSLVFVGILFSRGIITPSIVDCKAASPDVRFSISVSSLLSTVLTASFTYPTLAAKSELSPPPSAGVLIG